MSFENLVCDYCGTRFKPRLKKRDLDMDRRYFDHVRVCRKNPRNGSST